MIAYNSKWLDALAAKDAAQEWHKKGLLSDEKWQAIQAQNHSDFYSPNVFVRIGLTIFGLILMLAVMGLAALLFEPNSEAGFALFCCFWGTVWIAVLDFWAIRSARHFGSGVDDILLYTGLTTIILSLYNLLPYNTDTLVYCCIAWPFLLAGSIRYRDRLVAAATFICSLLIILFTINKIPSVALYLMPFTGMAFSAAVYFYAQRCQRNYDWRHWSGVFAVLELLALIAFYASGNYWIVQQVAYYMFGMPLPPMDWFFWIFTFLIPALYIYQGFVRKDRLLLDIGLACVAAAVFTFRYYYHVLPWAWAAAIAGAGLFLLAYFSIRYLQNNAGAYSYDAGSDKSLLQEAEEQLIEQTIATQTAAAPVKQDSFGGGQFGGGGAGSEF